MPKDTNEHGSQAAMRASANARPHAVDDSLTVSEDATGQAAHEVSVSSLLANDRGGQAKSLLGVESTGAGTVQVSADGQNVLYDTNGAFSHLAVGETATDSFEYTIQLGNGARSTATVTVTVTGTNHGPQATDDAYSLSKNTTLTIPAGTGVLANDSDIDGDVLEVSLATDAAHGTLVVNPDGSFSYTPDANFHGTDSFVYFVTDAHGATDTATVTLTVENLSRITNITNGSIGWSTFGAMSADGSKIMYTGPSDPAAPWATMRTIVYDVETGQSTTVPAEIFSRTALSADGSTIAFFNRDNLIDPDTPYYSTQANYLYLQDMGTGALELVTHWPNHFSFNPMLSHDGTVLGFTSQSSTLQGLDEEGRAIIDANGWRPDAFLHDRATGANINLTDQDSSNWDHFAQAMSADGSRLVYLAETSPFYQNADGSGPEIHEVDLYIYDASTGQAVMIFDGARDPNGGQPAGYAHSPTISEDGSKVAFTVTGQQPGLHVYDVDSGETIGVVGASGGSMTADGSKLAFTTLGLQTGDVFVFDTETRLTSNITEGVNGTISGLQISADGSKIVFSSNATNLVDGHVDLNGDIVDVFVFDVMSGEMTNVTDGGNGASHIGSISADGSRITFSSYASNLVEEEIDTNGNQMDIFVFDL